MRGVFADEPIVVAAHIEAVKGLTGEEPGESGGGEEAVAGAQGDGGVGGKGGGDGLGSVGEGLLGGDEAEGVVATEGEVGEAVFKVEREPVGDAAVGDEDSVWCRSEDFHGEGEGAVGDGGSVLTGEGRAGLEVEGLGRMADGSARCAVFGRIVVGVFPGPGKDVGAIGPSAPAGGEFFDAGGFLLGEVVLFGAVTVEVVQFPGPGGILGDEFPGAVAEGPVALVFPEDGLAGGVGIGEGGFEAAAFEGRDGFAAVLGGVGGAGEVEAGGHDVDEVSGLVAEGAAVGDAGGPVGDERCADAAFMHPVFVFAEGGVGDIGPGLAVGDVGVLGAGHDTGAVEGGDAGTVLFGNDVLAEGLRGDGRECGLRGAGGASVAADGFGATAIVLQEEDEGVVELAMFFQFGDEAADALVHGVNHRGVNFHAAGFPSFVGDFVPVTDSGGGGPLGFDQTEGAGFGEAGFANGVVALVVAAAVAGDVGFECVHGPVGGGVGDVQEEGFGGVVALVFGDEPDGVVADGVGVVELGGTVFGVVERADGRVVAGQGAGVEETAGAGDGAVVAVETALQGPVVFGTVGFDVAGDVPFAEGVGAITGGFEGFGEGDAVAVEVAAVAGESFVFHHVSDAGLVGVEARKQGGAGGTAAGGVVELGEAEAAGGEGVEGGGADFATVAAEVGESHVVGENDDEVGRSVGGGGNGEGVDGQQEGGEEECAGAVLGHGCAGGGRVTRRRRRDGNRRR